MDEPAQLNPAQQRTLALLRRSCGADAVRRGARRRSARPGQRGVRPLQRAARRHTLFVTKHTLASVHDCEVHFLAPDDFEWTPARARGQVAHKAIQLMLNWRGEPSPRELVDEALARLGDEERDFGRWIAALSPGDEADLRGGASSGSASSPSASRPSTSAAIPVTEAAAQWPLDHPILLRARVDLVMGRPQRSREPEGDHRPEDGPGQPASPRGSAVLRAGRNARPRCAAAQAGHLLPRLGRNRSSRT